MANILDRMRKLWGERRLQKTPVSVERRYKLKRKDVEQRYDESFDNFERTVRMKREDFMKFSSNDRQQVVIFSTFSEICDKRLDAGIHRLCRHPAHPAANTGVARCEEQVCPLMAAALAAA
jgi:hypothetical protein